MKIIFYFISFLNMNNEGNIYFALLNWHNQYLRKSRLGNFC